MAEAEYEDALDVLKKVDNKEEHELIQKKLVQTYQEAVEAYTKRGAYEEAYAMAQEGIDRIGDSVLADAKTKIYIQETEDHKGNGDFSGAINILKNGFEDIRDSSGQEKLRKERVTVYSMWADDFLAAEDYDNALWVLNEGISETGDTGLKEQSVEVYCSISDIYLAAGDCVSAVQILMDGRSDTESETLAERETYLRNNIVCVRKILGSGRSMAYEEYDIKGDCTTHIRWDFERLSLMYAFEEVIDLEAMNDIGIFNDSEYESEYNDTGNRTKTICYYKYDHTVSYIAEYEYDNAGNCIKETSSGDGYVAPSVTEYEYDILGNQIRWDFQNMIIDIPNAVEYLYIGE